MGRLDGYGGMRDIRATVSYSTQVGHVGGRGAIGKVRAPNRVLAFSLGLS